MAIHLAIDCIGNTDGGGATILLTFLKAAISDDRFSRVTVFCSPRSKRKFDLPDSPKIVSIEQPFAHRSYPYRVWWFERMVGRYCKTLAVDVLLCLNGMGRGYGGVPHVTHIQQSLPFSSEALKHCSLKIRFKMRIIRYLTRRSSASSAQVITQTPTMKSWVTDCFQLSSDRVAALLPPIHILSEECAHTAVLAQIMTIPIERRLLCIGGREGYRNTELAVHGLSLIRKALPDATLFLIFPNDHPKYASMEGVVTLEYVPRDVLHLVYESVTIFVQPSLVESANLSLAEAMMLGCPVLVADRPYAHDMCQDAGMFFDPLDPLDFAEKAVELLTSPNQRIELGKREQALIAARQDNYLEFCDILVDVVRRSGRGYSCYA